MSFLDDTDWTLINDFCGSQFWDPNITWNSDYPEITPCFEKTAFVWLPGLFLWIFSGIDIFITFNSKTRNIPWNWKCLGRLITLGLLIALCIAEFIYHINRAEEVFPVDFYTPLIKLASLVLCITLVIYHRKYGQRISGLMFLYWFLVVLMGFSQFYTEITGHLSSDETELRRLYFIVYYSLCFVMFLLYWLVDPPPKQSEHPKMKNPNPEENASFPSRLTFSWFDGLIYKGFKRPLSNKDLWSMNHQDSAAQLYQVFSKYWNKVYKKKTYKDEPAQFKKMANSVDFNGPREVKSKQVSIVPTLARAFGGVFLFASFLQLFDIVLIFASPEILKKVINFVSSDDEPIWHGYFYAALLLLVTTLQSLIQSQYNQRISLVGLRMRTSLTTAVYRKALKLSSAARKDSTLGEIVNLMAVDSQTFMGVTSFLNTLWSAPLQIALSLFFLWQQLGPSVLMGLGVMIVMIPANAFFANLTKNFQVKQMKYKDERVKTINEVLSGMKVLKLYGWEPSFEEKVQKIREKEASVLKKAAYLRSVVSFIWTCAPFLVSLLTFMTYVLVDEKNVLDSAKVFVSLSLFNIMKGPLAMVPMVISNLVQATVAIKRLNKFLNNEELDLNIISHDDKEDDPLVIEKGTFSWGADEEPILRNINLRVKPGSLVAVVGAVGSGKSSFLSTLLGEMHKVSGRVNTKGSIAYVPQLAWIQNCTLQDNILFGRNLDNKKYHKVIEACALKADLQMLPGGDQTEIGERGINVSGGQKQRISLARAVYADCDVYFLDDPLSAVDSHVGKHIFDNVISSSGVLKKKTRVLVTHGITFLPEVDMIVVLSDGEISEVGTYRELLEKKGAFSEFLITHLQDVPEEELEEIDTTMKEDIIKSNPEFHRQISISRSMRSLASTTSSVDSVRKRRSSQLSHKSENEKPKMEKLIVEEKSEEGRVQWTVYSKYFQAVGWFMFFTTAILSVANQGLQIGSNLWLSRWSDDQEIAINGTQDITKRNIYLSVYGLFGVAQTISAFFGSLAWYLGCVNAGVLLHYLLLLNIMRSPMSFFDTTPQGRILNRFSKEIDVIDNLIPFVMKQFFSMVTPVIGTLIVISYSTPIFLVLILPIGIFYYFLQKFYIASSQQLRRIESVSRSPVFSHFSESVSGAPVIRAYSAQKRFIKESEMKIDLNQSSSYSSIIASRWLAVRLQMIGNLIIFFATLFAIIGKDTLSPGIVGLSVSYTLQITGALNFLVQMTSEVENNIVAVERLKEYSITPQEAAWEISPSLARPDWPQEGKVEFVDYQVRYREGLELVLKGINLAIKGGEKIGIVGRTGAGKSSITLCLFRIIESAGGKILIDGIDIAKLGLHALRSRLTIIPQDPVLFSGSLRMNLDPFGHYSDEQVWRALELGHLKPFVKSLPAGLQHEVTEGGENISVGQRQLICLARALLRKTKILILDEATAAVDLETDDYIQKTIRSEFNDCTVLTIAHRINTIMDSDRVLVLDQGKVVEFDSPSELLKNKSSIFHGMAHDAGLV